MNRRFVSKIFLLAVIPLLFGHYVMSAAVNITQQPEPKKYRYYLAACAFFQNEAPYLKEWIEYHRIQGVEHFYLYNNGSTDNYLEVLTPYIAQNVVELTDWPCAPSVQAWMSDQMKAYNHCIKQCKDDVQWLAVIDIDEFIVPLDRENLVAFLKDYDSKPEVGAIKINWQLYGTSNLPCIPPGKLMIESLIFKAPWNYYPAANGVMKMPKDIDNAQVKSVVRPRAVKKFQIHIVDEHYPGFYSIPREHIDACRQPIQVDRICINHYWTRAEDFLHTVKFARRKRIMDEENLAVLMQKLQDLNHEKNTFIHKWLPELKRRLAVA